MNERTIVTIETNGVKAEFVVPVGKMSNVEKADKLRVYCEILKDIIEQVKEVVDPIIIDAGGSDNFSVVAETTSKTTSWKDVCKEAKVPDNIIEQFTKESKKKAYVKAKPQKMSL